MVYKIIFCIDWLFLSSAHSKNKIYRTTENATRSFMPTVNIKSDSLYILMLTSMVTSLKPGIRGFCSNFCISFQIPSCVLVLSPTFSFFCSVRKDF